MKKEKVNRSPLFYVGDKYKLVQEIKTHFPITINRFIEPFVGGGSVYLNVM
ncbi:MAG: DNA adenine methylase [Tannerella sp.]|jgi:DNA adenine methylase|nr:DNA adenine methylase [Tannerella sp.]